MAKRLVNPNGGNRGMSKISTRFRTQGPYQSDFDPNMADIQEFINNQVYVRGGSMQTPAGTDQSFPITLDGTARFLWGVTFYSDDFLDLVTLVLNRENIIQETPVVFFTPDINVKFGVFYPLPRPLNGADTMAIEITSQTSHNFAYALYLSDSRPAASGLKTK
jgi:hypothetical protein